MIAHVVGFTTTCAISAYHHNDHDNDGSVKILGTFILEKKRQTHYICIYFHFAVTIDNGLCNLITNKHGYVLNVLHTYSDV